MIWLISASGRIGSWFRYKVKSLENTSNTNRFIIFKNYTVNRHLSTRNNSNLSARAHSQGDNSYHCWAFSRVSCTTMIRHSWILFLQKTRHFFSAVFCNSDRNFSCIKLTFSMKSWFWPWKYITIDTSQATYFEGHNFAFIQHGCGQWRRTISDRCLVHIT